MAQQGGEALAYGAASASSLGEDSGIDDAGSSHGTHNQDNHGHHLLQAQFESDEASTDTDEG
jgi:hypothetical protein